MNQDLQDLRLGGLLLAFLYPILHFLTRLEDPENYEPLWQYLLLSSVFFLVVLSSFTRLEKRFSLLFTMAIFGVGLCALLFSVRVGFSGRRFLLNSIAMASGLVFRSFRMVCLYLAAMGVLFFALLLLVGSPFPLSVTVMRFMVGVLFVLIIAGSRSWAYERNQGAEQKFQSMILNSALPMMILRYERCSLVNKAAEQWLGVAPGDRLGDFILGEAPWLLSLTGRGIAPITFLHSNGEKIECQVCFTPFKGDTSLLHLVLLEKAQLPSPAGI